MCKITVFIIMYSLVIFIFPIQFLNAEPSNTVIVYELSGTFKSEYNSVGKMEMKLYSDGSMEGTWITNNKTFIGNIKGYYLIRENEIVLSSFGQSIIRSKIQTNIIIFASGEIVQNEILGEFFIYLENTNFPNDKGNWKASIKTH